MVQFNDWCDSADTPLGNHHLRVMTGRLADTATGIQVTATAVPAHYTAEERIAAALARLGKPAAAKMITDLLPADAQIRSGDLGEIYATEWINAHSGYCAPIKRLRWKDHRNMAMRGDDVIGMILDPATQRLRFLIYAGEAHSEYLAGSWTVDETFDVVKAAPADVPDTVRFGRGFMLGDGTGAGKGRQSAGIILDNWLQGRRTAVWISKSDKLIEDAQRDWSALGMERLLVTPLSRFPQGRPIALSEGVLFATYATLRSDDRGEKVSRVRQIVEWLGSDFDGVIIFDESHAMQNAEGGKGERGDVAPSQQGRAGLRLQHALPNARIVYVSATGATTVHNLAYAQRLGLWGGDDFPFATPAEFVEAIEDGGVAAMEVLARDLRSLGLYTARSLSYDDVEYELVEHQLTDEQRRIYDAYAGAFAIIHNHLDAAMEAANITGSTGTLNRQAKSVARSSFESAKQRFFGHLLTSMKTPTLIGSIERDLAAGHAAVVQIVSTMRRARTDGNARRCTGTTPSIVASSENTDQCR